MIHSSSRSVALNVKVFQNSFLRCFLILKYVFESHKVAIEFINVCYVKYPGLSLRFRSVLSTRRSQQIHLLFQVLVQQGQRFLQKYTKNMLLRPTLHRIVLKLSNRVTSDCSVYFILYSVAFKTRWHIASMIDLARQHQRLHHIWSIGVAMHFWSDFLSLLINLTHSFRTISLVTLHFWCWRSV